MVFAREDDRGDSARDTRRRRRSADHGTVAAASDWDGPMEVKDVRPAHEESYERPFHETGIEAGILHPSLPRQFDEHVWFDRTRAVQPLGAAELEGVPETYPFGVRGTTAATARVRPNGRPPVPYIQIVSRHEPGSHGSCDPPEERTYR